MIGTAWSPPLTSSESMAVSLTSGSGWVMKSRRIGMASMPAPRMVASAESSWSRLPKARWRAVTAAWSPSWRVRVIWYCASRMRARPPAGRVGVFAQEGFEKSDGGQALGLEHPAGARGLVGVFGRAGRGGSRGVVRRRRSDPLRAASLASPAQAFQRARAPRFSGDSAGVHGL